MKKIAILLLILGMLLIPNRIQASWLRYKMTIIVDGQRVYTDYIEEYDYENKWLWKVPYTFREDETEEKCRISAYIELKRENW